MILFDNDLKPSKACIRYFIEQAIDRKKWAESLAPEWYEMASDCSKDMAYEYKTESVHILARSSMHYARMRAKLGGLDEYPRDRPARELWFKLNPIQPIRREPSCNDEIISVILK